MLRAAAVGACRCYRSRICSFIPASVCVTKNQAASARLLGAPRTQHASRTPFVAIRRSRRDLTRIVHSANLGQGNFRKTSADSSYETSQVGQSSERVRGSLARAVKRSKLHSRDIILFWERESCVLFFYYMYIFFLFFRLLKYTLVYRE